MLIPMIAATAALNASTTSLLATGIATRSIANRGRMIGCAISVGEAGHRPKEMTSDEFKRRRYMEKHYGVIEFDSSTWTGRTR